MKKNNLCKIKKQNLFLWTNSCFVHSYTILSCLSINPPMRDEDGVSIDIVFPELNAKGPSRRCNFAHWDKGQCPHGPLFHAVSGRCKCFQQCRLAGLRYLGHLGAIRHCWKHLQHPGTAWNNAPWGHCPTNEQSCIVWTDL